MNAVADPAVSNPDALADELSDLIATESRGLLRHVAGSNLHVDEKTYRLRQAVERIDEHSRTHVQRITAVMDALQLDPRARSYPMDVTYYHYDRADSLLGKLLEEKRRQVAAYERAIEHLGHAPKARGELEALLAENRDHLAQLQNAAPTA